MLPEGRRPLRILLVDDQPTVRDALNTVIDGHSALLVVGEAADGVEAVHRAWTLAPDVILMDLTMPRMGGIEATKRICACVPTARIFGLAAEEDALASHAVEQAGAEGDFSKGAGLTRLVERLLTLHAESVGG
jgi:DNA-binding NarL/FixJ family response regulator